MSCTHRRDLIGGSVSHESATSRISARHEMPKYSRPRTGLSPAMASAAISALRLGLLATLAVRARRQAVRACCRRGLPPHCRMRGLRVALPCDGYRDEVLEPDGTGPAGLSGDAVSRLRVQLAELYREGDPLAFGFFLASSHFSSIPVFNSGILESVTKTAVYRFYDNADVLLYVGVADVPEVRWKGHADKDWWPDVARKETEWHPDRDAAEIAEAYAIRDERPVHNRTAADPERMERIRTETAEERAEGRLEAAAPHRCPDCQLILPALKICANEACGKQFYRSEAGREDAVYCSGACAQASREYRRRKRQKAGA